MTKQSKNEYIAEFYNRYNRLPTEEPHKPLNVDDIADCYCNISEQSKIKCIALYYQKYNRFPTVAELARFILFNK